MNPAGALKIKTRLFRKIDACRIDENTFFCTAGMD